MNLFKYLNIFGYWVEYALGKIKAKAIVASLGRKSTISYKINYLQGEDIYIGSNVEIRKHSSLDARTEMRRGIEISDYCRIKENVALICYTGHIDIGRKVLVGRNSVIMAHGGVKIGEKTMLSPNCTLIASNHVFSNSGIDFQDQGFTKERIEIGRNVWIGNGVTVLGGSIIEDNVVVAAGSVVNGKKLEKGGLYAGVPVKFIRKIKPDEIGDRKVYFKNWGTYTLNKDSQGTVLPSTD